MKKLMWSVVLSLILVIGMVGCKNQGNETEPVKEEKKKEKVKAIDITLDNWQEYFELTEEKDLWKNDFGEITQGYIENWLKLKDEYKPAVDKETSIAIEYRCVMVWRYIEVNKETGEIKVGDIVPDLQNPLWQGESSGVFTTTTTISSEGTTIGEWSATENENGTMQTFVTDFEMLRVQGTLYILE